MTTVEMVRSLYMMRCLHEVHLIGSLRVSWWILPQRWHEYGSDNGAAELVGSADKFVCRGVGSSMTPKLSPERHRSRMSKKTSPVSGDIHTKKLSGRNLPFFLTLRKPGREPE